MTRIINKAVWPSMIILSCSFTGNARSQVHSKTPIGCTEYMGWFPGDSVAWVSDDSGNYYYYDYSQSPPKLVRGRGKAAKLPHGVVSISGEYACKTSDLQHIRASSRFSASCTSEEWRKN
jgi:hypothetical protein